MDKPRRKEREIKQRLKTKKGVVLGDDALPPHNLETYRYWSSFTREY